MSLSALVDDRLVCGPLVDEDTWAQVRGRTIILQPCGHAGFPRVSRQGTRHFAHVRQSGCDHAESAEHLRVKADIAAAVAAAGWEAATEVPGPGFVADVLARRGRTRVALEVQRSRQVLREYEQRQATYEAAGIRGAWFAAAVPAGHQAGPRLPLFIVRDWLTEPVCVVSGRTVAVGALVAGLLTGECRWRATVPARTASQESLRQMCPMCGACREVQLARWSIGGCECGLPIASPGPGITRSDSQRCCGYWGPGMVLGIRTRSAPYRGEISAGHWCLSGQAGSCLPPSAPG